jgi:hypothetical protein
MTSKSPLAFFRTVFSLCTPDSFEKFQFPLAIVSPLQYNPLHSRNGGFPLVLLGRSLYGFHRFFKLSALLTALTASLAGCGAGGSNAGPPPYALAITTTSLTDGTVGTAYSVRLAATGGIAPYIWAVTKGTLPAGLTLTASKGVISGIPTAGENTLSLTFGVTDSRSPVDKIFATLSLTIANTLPALAITTTSLSNGVVGTAYSVPLAATGGTAPYTWAVTNGTLPAGLTLAASTGVISGTPSAAVTALSLTFAVTDSSSPAQTQSATLSLTIAKAPPALAITTTSLSNGVVGKAYSVRLAATGGTVPYSWTVTKGTLPAGLTLAASTGVISGTPSAAVTALSLTFAVTDSSSPAQIQFATLRLTIAFMVTVSPARAAIVVNQALSISAITSDGTAVVWSLSGSGCSGAACGTLSGQSGAALTYTAPAAVGHYNLTATSVENTTKSASLTVAVTDLAGVTTWHNNQSRNGANMHEYSLNPTNVNTAEFGKLFSCPVDGAIYAQPLWMPQLTIGSARHNVVVVATQHDSLYAFDADAASSPCTPLWQVSLIDAAHGGTTGETSVPSGVANALVGHGYGDIAPEVGVTGTPVIDASTNTLYVVSKSVIPASTTFFQRLHGIDLLTGKENFAGPVIIAGTYPGHGDGGSTTTFVPRQENQRAGLALANGTVYIAWASHEDNYPYYGWVMAYDAHTLAQKSVFNDTPDYGWGGIWMGGAAPSVDAAGNIFLITGNGKFNADNPTAPNRDYGDSLLKLAPGLTVSRYFTPSDQLSDQQNDADFGSGGTAILVELPTNGANPTHLIIGGGKDTSLYLLDRDHLGGSGDANAWQHFSIGTPVFSTGGFWNSTLYIAGAGGRLNAFSLDTGTAKMNPIPTSTSSNGFGFPGSTPSISARANSNGIVWEAL